MKTKKSIEEMEKEERRAVGELLRKCAKTELDESHALYAADPETVKALLSRKNGFASKLRRAGYAVDRDPYYRVVKIINPKAAEAAVYYNVTETKRYVYVKDKESILRNIDREYEIWKNSLVKSMRVEIAAEGEGGGRRIAEKVERQIARAYETKEWIKENIDEVEILWTTYPRAKNYLSVYYKTVKGKYKISHLRQHVFNVIQYVDTTAKKDDSAVEAFIKGAENVFGDFYLKTPHHIT